MTLRAALLVVACLARLGECGEPLFDPATLMRLVLVPADAAVGSVVYRVRASDSDFDYPLQFELIGQMGRLDIAIETLPCTRYNSVCQANVILQRRLEPGRYVDFRLSVRNTRGRSARIACSITGTNATTPRDTIFPHQPGIILVPEDAKRGSDLEIVIARKNPMSSKPLELELWGSPLFAIRQRRVSTENTEGAIFLLGPLDFETQSMYHLTLFAVDPYVEIGKDTRNIAGLEVVVVVEDVQDMPPVFTHAPPITHLPKQLVPGDIILRVRAEDGDKGAPRQIRYGLVSEGNPFTPFFNINETTGELTLAPSGGLEEMAAISHAGSPVLLTVVAEEVRRTREEPEAMSTTVQLAFILPERDNTPPYFENSFYITYLDENSPQGTALVFTDPYIPQVSDGDSGKNAVFSLSLVGNNGTFEISPTVAERHTQFIVRVRDNVMLDYEARKSVVFQIVAQELGPVTNLSASSNVTVYLNDVNDNSPVFLELSYDVELAENVTAGTRVAQVAAEDVDTGIFGKVQYTAILGYLNTSLHLDPMTGIITVATSNHGFDREAMPDLHFLVEARDMDGVGLRETVPLVIKLLDVNDNQPQFERTLYEFVLSPSMDNFTSSAFIKAVDKDAEPPNNVVRYELIQGNTEAKFAVNGETGELYLLEPIKRYPQDIKRQKRQFESDEESEVYVLMARAYDLGVPRLFSTTMIKVYPPESKTKTMSFIVPGANPDRKKLEDILSTLSGGKVTILDVRPYKGIDADLPDVSSGNSQEKSVVVAIVRQTGNTAINIAKLQEQLAKNQTIISSSSDQSETIPGSTNSNSSGIYKAENRLLFWMLILLAIIIAIVLLCLICCCICEGCPLYMPPRKRVIRVNSTEDDVHLVVRDKGNGRENKSTQQIENKSVQASEWRRREAWSAEQADLRTRPTQWKFNRRNYQSKEPSKPASTPGDLRQEFIIPAAAKDLRYDGRRSMRMRDGPNVIFTKEMQLQEAFANKHREYMEDLENGYDRIATLHHQRRDADNDSIRRHEMERGSQVYLRSDLEKEFERKAHAPSSLGRDQYFIKEGNTEILRLVTRGNEEERYVNLPAPQQRPVTLIPHTQYVVVDSGKDLLMQRFIREQGEEAKYLRERLSNVDIEHMHISDEKDQPKSFTQNSQAGSDVPNIYQSNAHEYIHQEVPGAVPLKAEHLRNALNEFQNKTTVNQDLLESSLRKQNELLHQILLERERVLQQETASQIESKLETQSLPGHSVMATQTDCHMSTQTEPQLLKPSRRKARSDNDSYSEDDTQTIIEDEVRQIAWVKRKKPRKKIKYKDYNPRKSVRVYDIKRKIRTPILEENEISPAIDSEKHIKVSKSNQRVEHIKSYGDSRTSVVKTSKNETISSTEIKISDTERQAALQREVLLEISDSLDDPGESSSSVKTKRTKLRRQKMVAESYDEETEEYHAEEVNIRNENITNDMKHRCGSASNDNRNLVFSRQGSSTETRELAHELTHAHKPVTEEVYEPTKEQIDTKDSSSSADSRAALNQNLLKGSSAKPYESEGPSKTEKDISTARTATKSVPRYMQWYSKKTTIPVSKVPTTEKVIPSKPKRNSKITVKKDQEKSTLENEKAAHYGKIVSKELHEDSEAKKNAKLKEKDFRIHPRLLKEEKVTPVPEGPLPDVHPLLQHSEHRYEHQYENQNPLSFVQPTHIPQYLGMHAAPPVLPQRKSVTQQPIYVNQDQLNQNTDSNKISEGALTHSISISTSYEEEKPTEVHISKISIGSDTNTRSTAKLEDNDSGIAMVHQTGNIRRLPITEKKSIFTIAYDDVHTKQLRPDSSSTSY